MSIVRRLHVPVRWPEEVVGHLGAPHHWKAGRSAHSVVSQWWHDNAIPPSIQRLLDGAEEWRGAKLVDAFVERKTDLDDGRPSASQSDLLAIVALAQHLGILVIEAKVDEGFDRTVAEWRPVDSAGKTRRLDRLCQLLEFDRETIGSLRYQLLHRTAAAIYEARRYKANQAAVIVQSWCADQTGFEDFADFELALGLGAGRINTLSEAVVRGGISLRLGWSMEVQSTHDSPQAKPPPPAGPPATS